MHNKAQSSKQWFNMVWILAVLLIIDKMQKLHNQMFLIHPRKVILHNIEVKDIKICDPQMVLPEIARDLNLIALTLSNHMLKVIKQAKKK